MVGIQFLFITPSWLEGKAFEAQKSELFYISHIFLLQVKLPLFRRLGAIQSLKL